MFLNLIDLDIYDFSLDGKMSKHLSAYFEKCYQSASVYFYKNIFTYFHYFYSKFQKNVLTRVKKYNMLKSQM